ncbi:MAG: hypothetical protein Q7J73_05445 [Dehalococcoidales bacterium]|nr:hypothetical protein [Dehalococcoidales bacterium]
MRMVKIIVILLGGALLIITGITGACSSTRQTPRQTAPPMAATVIILAEPEQRMAGFNYEGDFRPHTTKVALGAAVTWNNTDNIVHTVVSDDGLFNQRLQPGESFSYTFTQNGSFKYRDVLYGGMDGIIYVE